MKLINIIKEIKIIPKKLKAERTSATYIRLLGEFPFVGRDDNNDYPEDIIFELSENTAGYLEKYLNSMNIPYDRNNGWWGVGITVPKAYFEFPKEKEGISEISVGPKKIDAIWVNKLNRILRIIDPDFGDIEGHAENDIFSTSFERKNIVEKISNKLKDRRIPSETFQRGSYFPYTINIPMKYIDVKEDIKEIRIISKKLKAIPITDSTIKITNLPSFDSSIVANINYHPYGEDKEGKVIISLKNNERMEYVENDLDNMKIPYEVDETARRRSILVPIEYLDLIK